MQQNPIIHNISIPLFVASNLVSLTSQPIKHGQTAHVLWQKHGSFVRVLYQSFNSFFKQSLTVINQWRANLVAISGLRTLTCHKCNKENFYIEIQTTVESEFFAVLSGKFVCPNCKENMKC